MQVKLFAALCVSGAMLSGCSGGGKPFALFGAKDTGPRAAATVEVLGDFVVAGPRGFCIDEGTGRETGETAFVMLGSCAVISGNPHDAKPRKPAFLTVSLARAPDPVEPDMLERMAAFFMSEAGRDALAREGAAGPVEIVDMARGDALVLVHARDGAGMGDMASEYWRGIFPVAGQLATITVSGFRTSPLSARDGERLARKFVDAIRRANTEAADGADGLASLFSRLL